MKKITPFLIFCWFSTIGWAQESTQMSLDEAVQYALENNSAIRSAQINITDADEQIIQRRAIGLPQVNADISYQRYLEVPISVLPESFVALSRDPITGELPPGFSREVSFVLRNSFTAGASLNTMLFDGSYFTGLRAAREFRNFVQLELTTKKREVRNQAVNAYLPSLLLTESLKMLDKNIDNLTNLRDETQAMYKEGFVEQLDVDRLNLSLANLQVERENLVRQKQMAINALKFSIYYPMDKELELSDNLEDIVEEAKEEDLVSPINYMSRPEYNLVNKSLELNELNIRFNRAGYLPVLNAFASYQQQWQGNTTEDGFWAPTAVAGLRLSIPIFDGFRKKAVIQRARLDLELNKIQQRDLEKAITLEVQNARIQYISAKERLDSQQRNLNLAERIYETAQIKYKEGVGSSLELSQAEQSLYQTQQNYIQAQYDLLTAKIALDQALGK